MVLAPLLETCREYLAAKKKLSVSTPELWAAWPHAAKLLPAELELLAIELFLALPGQERARNRELCIRVSRACCHAVAGTAGRMCGV